MFNITLVDFGNLIAQNCANPRFGTVMNTYPVSCLSGNDKLAGLVVTTQRVQQGVLLTGLDYFYHSVYCSVKIFYYQIIVPWFPSDTKTGQSYSAIIQYDSMLIILWTIEVYGSRLTILWTYMVHSMIRLVP